MASEINFNGIGLEVAPSILILSEQMDPFITDLALPIFNEKQEIHLSLQELSIAAVLDTDATLDKTKFLSLGLLAADEDLNISQIQDPYLWLEEIRSNRSLSWVERKNKETETILEAVLGFNSMREQFISILNKDEKLPYGVIRDGFFYQYYTDSVNSRGMIRRTPIESYEKIDHEEPSWEVVFSLDALCGEENENWVYIRSSYWNGLGLLEMSRGGSDAVVVREFNYETKQFVEDGFCLPEAKSIVCWKDSDTIYVGTDFGPGSLTISG